MPEHNRLPCVQNIIIHTQASLTKHTYLDVQCLCVLVLCMMNYVSVYALGKQVDSATGMMYLFINLSIQYLHIYFRSYILKTYHLI